MAIVLVAVIGLVQLGNASFAAFGDRIAASIGPDERSPDAPSEPIEDDRPAPDVTDDVEHEGAIDPSALVSTHPLASSARDETSSRKSTTSRVLGAGPSPGGGAGFSAASRVRGPCHRTPAPSAKVVNSPQDTGFAAHFGIAMAELYVRRGRAASRACANCGVSSRRTRLISWEGFYRVPRRFREESSAVARRAVHDAERHQSPR